MHRVQCRSLHPGCGSHVVVMISSVHALRFCRFAVQCVAKPEGDIYKFTHFAHKLMSGKGINPLPSDARRRRDRLALQVRTPQAKLQASAVYRSHRSLIALADNLSTDPP